MKAVPVAKTPYYSWKAGELADGCKLCVKGEKLVLFVTGLCGSRCDFCPLSDKKLYKDVIYANERPLSGEDDVEAIIEEAEACGAKGAGITGGDPLVKLDRTIKYIRLLKERFGEDFHIHLYTPLVLVDEKKLCMLYEAGLDEIRFHPKLVGKEVEKGFEKEWEKISLAKSIVDEAIIKGEINGRKKEFSWSVGVEIPALPEKEVESKRLIDFIIGKVDFININELEVADNAVWKDKIVKCKDDASYAVKGSEEVGKRLLGYAARKGLRAHYCTCTLKDKVQLANRILRRAERVKQEFDTVTEDGMLVRGAFYLPDLAPGFGYHDRLEKLRRVENQSEKEKILNNLRLIRERVLREEELPERLLVLDENKLRLITSPWLATSIKPKGVVRAVVTEYPTFDAVEVEVDILS